MQVLRAVALVTLIIGGYNYGFRELELDILLACIVVVDDSWTVVSDASCNCWHKTFSKINYHGPHAAFSGVPI